MARDPAEREAARHDQEDTTRKLTGADAPRDEAETGSAGDGASAFGADRTGVGSPAPEYEEQYKLEEDPSHPEDIMPDKVERGFSDPADEDREYDARPEDDVRPITPDLLPSDDPGAAEG